jgi:hypothetical protein
MRGILLVLALSAAAADTVPASLESQRRAQAVVEAALKAHGGDRTNGKLHVRYRAETVTEGQSQAALAPFEAYPFEVEIALDPTAGLVFARTDGWISGDFHFPYRTVLRQGKGFSYDPVVNTTKPPATRGSWTDIWPTVRCSRRCETRPPSAISDPTGNRSACRTPPPTASSPP